MSGPPARPSAQLTFRKAEKQARAFEEREALCVASQDGFLVARLHSSDDSARLRRLQAAPNAVLVRQHGGKLVEIKLQSLGSDRGFAGEKPGRFTVAMEGVRNDNGQYVGSNKSVKRKETGTTLGETGGESSDGDWHGAESAGVRATRHGRPGRTPQPHREVQCAPTVGQSRRQQEIL